MRTTSWWEGQQTTDNNAYRIQRRQKEGTMSLNYDTSVFSCHRGWAICWCQLLSLITTVFFLAFWQPQKLKKIENHTQLQTARSTYNRIFFFVLSLISSLTSLTSPIILLQDRQRHCTIVYSLCTLFKIQLNKLRKNDFLLLQPQHKKVFHPDISLHHHTHCKDTIIFIGYQFKYQYQ